MEPLAAADVTSSSDELGVMALDMPSSSPVTLQSSLSPVHSTSRLMDRRWSTPDECGNGSDLPEPPQQCCHSADVPSSKRLSDWETVESGVVNLQPTTRLIYSGVPSHASPQHNIFPVVSSFCLCLQHASRMLLRLFQLLAAGGILFLGCL